MWLLDRRGFVPSDRDRLTLRALSRLFNLDGNIRE